MSETEHQNQIEQYWRWLDTLDPIAQQAILAEDKDGFGRPDPDFNGQAIIYMLNRCDSFEQFERIAMPIFENREHLILWWNIYLAGVRYITDEITEPFEEGI